MMRFWKKNDGFTLVELLVVITVGSLVSFAATSILLFAMRFNRVNLDTIEHQSVLRIMLNVVESLSSDEGYTIDVNADNIKKGTSAVISYGNNQIVTGAASNPNGVLMKNVEAFDIKKPSVLELYTNAAEDLYTFSIKLDGQYFDSTIYARTKAVKIAEQEFMYSVFPLTHQNDWEADDPDKDYEIGREYLVNLAASQIGSDGRIMDYPRGREGTYYTLWYNNATTFPPGWSEETPWCSVFVSWLINETAAQGSRYTTNNVLIPYLNRIPKEANVNHMWLRLYNGINMSNYMINNHGEDTEYINTPQPGDLIFFEFVEERFQYEDANEYLEPLKMLDPDVMLLLDLKISYEKEQWYANKAHPTDDRYIITKDSWERKSEEERNLYEEYTVINHYLECRGDGLDHVGIVAKVENGVVYTIEGNSETLRVDVNETTVVNQVVLRKYALDDENIFGYVTLDWNLAYK